MVFKKNLVCTYKYVLSKDRLFFSLKIGNLGHFSEGKIEYQPQPLNVSFLKNARARLNSSKALG